MSVSSVLLRPEVSDDDLERSPAIGQLAQTVQAALETDLVEQSLRGGLVVLRPIASGIDA